MPINTVLQVEKPPRAPLSLAGPQRKQIVASQGKRLIPTQYWITYLNYWLRGFWLCFQNTASLFNFCIWFLEESRIICVRCSYSKDTECPLPVHLQLLEELRVPTAAIPQPAGTRLPVRCCGSLCHIRKCEAHLSCLKWGNSSSWGNFWCSNSVTVVLVLPSSFMGNESTF